MTLAAGGLDTRALWYLARGTGMVSLVLLTAVVVLGVLTTVRWSRPGWPRFVTMDLHRNLSLMVVVFVGVHVVTAVADPFAPLSLLDAVVPFGGRYRPVWVGLGALAFDLLVALVVTSLLRLRLGHRRWRATHWLAYLAWPVAVLHGLGTGSDVRVGWDEAVTWGCVAAVVAAVWWRVGHRWPDHAPLRAAAGVASVAVPLALGAFTVAGPLQAGWARRAGTPSSILASGGSTVEGAATQAGVPAALTLPYTGAFDGRIRQTQRPDGTSVVRLSGPVVGDPRWQLVVELRGQSLDNGGVAMTSSSVVLTSGSLRYEGDVRGLQGNLLLAGLADAGHPPLQLRLRLTVSQDAAHGAVTLTNAGGSGQ